MENFIKKGVGVILKLITKMEEIHLTIHFDKLLRVPLSEILTNYFGISCSLSPRQIDYFRSLFCHFVPNPKPSNK